MAAYVLLQLLGPSMLPAGIAPAPRNGGAVGILMGRRADTLALRPDAPQGIDLYAYEIVPRLCGQFLAYALNRWEIIVRESGILGVRTLGYHVDAAISELRLDVAVVLIVATGTLRRRRRVDDRPVRLSAADAPVTTPAEPACV